MVWIKETLFRSLDQWEQAQGCGLQEGWEETVTRQLDQWSQFLTDPSRDQALDLGTGPEGFEEVISLPSGFPSPSSILSKRLSRWAPAPSPPSPPLPTSFVEEGREGQSTFTGELGAGEEEEEEDSSLSGSTASSTLYSSTSSASSLSSSGVCEVSSSNTPLLTESTIRVLEEGEPDEFIPPNTIPLPKGGFQFMSMSELLSPDEQSLPPPIQPRPLNPLPLPEVKGFVHDPSSLSQPPQEKQQESAPLEEVVVVKEDQVTLTKEEKTLVVESEGTGSIKRVEGEDKLLNSEKLVLNKSTEDTTKRTEATEKKGDKTTGREKGQKNGEWRSKGRGRSGSGQARHHRKSHPEVSSGRVNMDGHDGSTSPRDTMTSTSTPSFQGIPVQGGGGGGAPTSRPHTYRRPYPGHPQAQGYPQSQRLPQGQGYSQVQGNHRGRGGWRSGRGRNQGRGGVAGSGSVRVGGSP